MTDQTQRNRRGWFLAILIAVGVAVLLVVSSVTADADLPGGPLLYLVLTGLAIGVVGGTVIAVWRKRS